MSATERAVDHICRFDVGLSFCPVYAFVVDDWLTIVLALGLGVRIMRLITLDAITQPIRDRLSGFFGALIECPWCTGVWIAVPVGLSWWAWSDQTWWQVIALIATIAWACGALSNAGMPSQHEVSTVSPVALINADGAATDTVEVKFDSELTITDSEVEAAVARVLKKRAGEAASGEAV
jgi:hypothetical protein